MKFPLTDRDPMASLRLGIWLLSLSFSGASASAGTFTTLHGFTGADGSLTGVSSYFQASVGAMVLGENGVLYGTTSAGGPSNRGTVFSMTPPKVAGGTWTHAIVYDFEVPGDSGTPAGGVAIGPTGAMYGFTYVGGRGVGAAYEITPPKAGGQWTGHVIYAFDSSHAGVTPIGRPLVIGRSVYGVTSDCTYGGDGKAISCGTVFRLDPPAKPAGAWTGTVLYSFKAHGDQDMVDPRGYLVAGAKGKLIGIAAQRLGGASYIFQLTPPASGKGAWTETVIRKFPSAASDASFLIGPIALAADGSIYGTTIDGSDYGQIFKLTPPAAAGKPWTKIASGAPFSDQLAQPTGGALIGPGGAIYTSVSGSNGICEPHCRALLRIVPPAHAGGAWTSTVEHIFTGGRDGGDVLSQMTLDGQGNIYGLTSDGGNAGDIGGFSQPHGWGTVFQLKP